MFAELAIRLFSAGNRGARLQAVLSEVRGRLVDIGCGDNRLVRTYGSGAGVDVHDWGDVDILVEDSSRLPIPDASVDTVTFVACLNHIPNRQAVLREAHRILSPRGRIVVTMIPPTLSRIWHRVIRRLDPDQTDRHQHDGEVWGLRSRDVKRLFALTGFHFVSSRRFRFFLNTLYLGVRKPELALSLEGAADTRTPTRWTDLFKLRRPKRA